MQTFRRIVRQDRYLPLRNDLPVIDFFINIMDGAASHRFAGRESLFPCFEARKFRQKRWMDVNDTPGKRLEHRRVQHAHKAGENHEMNAGVAQYFHKFLFCFWLQTRAKLAGRQIRIRNGKLSRDIKDWCVEHIRNHHTRFRGKVARADVLEDRSAVASLSRSKNSYWQPFHLNRSAFRS